MELLSRPTFDHKDRRDIYEYVESNGASDPDRVRRVLGLEPHAFGHHLAILKRDSVLVEEGGRLRVAFESGMSEEYEAEGCTFTIRQAREEDLTGLVGAIRVALETGEDVEAESVADVIDTEGVLLRHNNIESRVFFVATVSDDVVGWVHLKHRELKKLNHTAKLTVGVLEQYQGQGIGTRLLERGLEWAASNGVEKIYNSVPSSNERGIAFFELRGFKVEAVRKKHYKINGEYHDEVMMAKEL